MIAQATICFCILTALITEASREADSGKYRYFQSAREFQFEEAETDCQRRGGHLLSVHSAVENAFANELQTTGEAFIGRLWKNGKHQWTGGSTDEFSNWENSAAEPTSSSPCAVMISSSGKWRKVNCYESRRYLCRLRYFIKSLSLQNISLSALSSEVDLANASTIQANREIVASSSFPFRKGWVRISGYLLDSCLHLAVSTDFDNTSCHLTMLCQMRLGDDSICWFRCVCPKQDCSGVRISMRRPYVLASISVHKKMIHCRHGGGFDIDSGVCSCQVGMKGIECQNVTIKSCREFKEMAQMGTAYFQKMVWIHIDGMQYPMQVICTGWGTSTALVIMKRDTYYPNDASFSQNMSRYISGFGSLKQSHWLGLDAMYYYSRDKNCMLSIDVSRWNNSISKSEGLGINWKFRIKGFDDGYRLNLSRTSNAYSQGLPTGCNCCNCIDDDFTPEDDGTVSMSGPSFSTIDQDEDNNTTRHCAEEFQIGWWFGIRCSRVNILSHEFQYNPSNLTIGHYPSLPRIPNWTIMQIYDCN